MNPAALVTARDVLTCNRLEELAALGEPLHLALGVFDGVHLGHQAVIARAAEAASKQGGLAGLVTFDPHPIRVIAPGKAPAALLATLEHKAEIVRDLGLGLFVPIHFDKAFAAMEADAFVRNLCQAPLRTITVGEDWRFGRDRGGDVPFLRKQAEKHGFHLQAVPPVMFEGDRISSTRIRQAIHDGNITEAARMLGRPYSISGTVQRGRQLGRTIGFPTANLPTGSVQLPPDGVWAVRVAGAREHLIDGVANLGIRPTVGGQQQQLEIHLFDFHGDLYGQTLNVRFEKHLRPEQRFPSLEALKSQILRDAALARTVLAENPL